MSELSLGIMEFIGLMAKAQHHQETALHRALEKAARLVEKEAKAEIGFYQDAVGPFIEWDQLHKSTLHGGTSPKTGVRFEGKIELGYATEDEHNPLLRDGTLRDSIKHAVEVNGHEGVAVIGSDLIYAAVQELGDAENNQLPRSYLGGAMVRKTEEVGKILGENAVKSLFGADVEGGTLKLD